MFFFGLIMLLVIIAHLLLDQLSNQMERLVLGGPRVAGCPWWCHLEAQPVGHAQAPALERIIYDNAMAFYADEVRKLSRCPAVADAKGQKRAMIDCMWFDADVFIYVTSVCPNHFYVLVRAFVFTHGV